ncbi:NAD-dependent epimerase/dehydratase family protein [Diaminobutyricibacter sp. McL0608]|uniref:NAD-dependent epimerase/dehydratase family protein n=1 Tax=Leifsonia sp. McL0608 TaxID=3143537 RepID=UPI0031F2F296
MRVLVTGASSYLGGAVASALVAQGYDVRTLQRRPSNVAGAVDVLGDVTDAVRVRTAVEGVEAVVHLAAKVSLAGAVAEFDRVNVGGTSTLLAEARMAGVRRIVHVSSPSVAHVGASLIGEPTRPADPSRARGDYARTKAAGELLALAADAPGFAVVVVRPHLVWGPGDPQLVGRIVGRARRGRLPVIGSGAALIDTTYIDNAVSGLVAALHDAEKVHGRSYVLTNGEPRPVAELLTGICTACGAPAPSWRVPPVLARTAGGIVEALWRSGPGRDEPPMTRFLAEQLSTAHWFDQRRIRDDLQWSPTVTIDDGLARLAVWWAKSQELGD